MAVKGDLSSESTRESKLSWKKKVLFSSIISMLMLGVLELCSRMALSDTSGYEISIASLRAEQMGIAASARAKDSARENLHPYVGWTFDPLSSTGTEEVPINVRGLLDFSDSIQKKQPGQFIIAITGGSFAQEFNDKMSEELATRLSQHMNLEGREVHIVRLAMAGYKQPQQLMWLTYLYSIGGEFDCVINLDGFNEGVLPITDNYNSKVHFSYPYGWDKRLLDIVDPRLTDLSFDILALRAKRQKLAKGVLDSPIRFLAMRNLIWRIQNSRISQELNQISLEKFDYRWEFGKGFAVSGPPNPDPQTGDLQTSVIDLWKNCSLQMRNLCVANNTKYIHFLQPNQYLDNSKTLSDWENEFAYDPKHDFHQVVLEMYPRMRAESEWFAEHNVKFHDLTQIFKETTETTYRDWCCHVNNEGNQLVAEAVLEAIIEKLNTGAN